MAAIASASVRIPPPCGRLSLVTATPILTSDQLTKTTIYYVPYIGNRMPGRLGTRWNSTIISEMSLALDSDSGHTGYHQSGKNFDLFYDMTNSRICTGPAWASDTARADALVLLDGLWVNNASIVVRFGSSSGNTATIGANMLVYLGTFRASANGQTEMSFAPTKASGGTNNKLYLWNAHNRKTVRARCRDSASPVTIGATQRSLNNSASNRFSFVRGLDEGHAEAALEVIVGASATPGSNAGYITIGIDSTTAPADESWYSGHGIASALLACIAQYWGMPGLGFHYLQAQELATGSSTQFTAYLDTSMSYLFNMEM